MKTALFYAVFTALNLVAFAVAVAMLPSLVGVAFSAGEVLRTGSPWIFLAYPAVSAFLALGMFAVMLPMKGKMRLAGAIAVATAGAVFLCVGWTFYGLGAAGADVGEKVLFPYAAVSAMPLSLALLSFGCAFPALSKRLGLSPKCQRAGELAFSLAGLVSFLVSLTLTALPRTPRLDWIALLVFALSLGAAAATFFVLKSHFTHKNTD